MGNILIIFFSTIYSRNEENGSKAITHNHIQTTIIPRRAGKGNKGNKEVHEMEAEQDNSTCATAK